MSHFEKKIWCLLGPPKANGNSSGKTAKLWDALRLNFEGYGNCFFYNITTLVGVLSSLR